MGLIVTFFDMTTGRDKPGKKKKKNRRILKYAKINHPRNGFEAEYIAGKKWCAGMPMKNLYIKSFDGLRLHGSYLQAKNPKRTILLCHGYKATSYGDFAGIARFLYENDSNLLFIDERCCGKSEGKYITFGAKEKKDIYIWLRLLCKKNKEHLPIYIYGYSMGAASAMMSLEYRMPADIKGVIADCGYSSFSEQIKHMAKDWFHIKHTNYIIFILDIYYRVFSHFRIKDADTSSALIQNKIPILFFHGLNDTYVMPVNTYKNYSLCSSDKYMYCVPGARHLCSCYLNPGIYQKKLLEFFGRYD